MPGIIPAHFPEIAVSADYGPGVGNVKLCEEHQEGESVGEAAQQKHLAAPSQREVLVEEKEVVAEVEIGLLRIPLGKRRAADVIHHAVGDGIDRMARRRETAAEVNLLHMGEEERVEASEGSIILRPHRQGSSGSPGNLTRNPPLTNQKGSVSVSVLKWLNMTEYARKKRIKSKLFASFT